VEQLRAGGEATDLIVVFRLVGGERHLPRLANFDALGALLVTSGMLLLIYALVEAPPSVGARQARSAGSPAPPHCSPRSP
jgi:hypothetical protein